MNLARTHCNAALAVFFALAGCSTHLPNQPITVEQILASPQKFDGKEVLVKGVFLMPMTGAERLFNSEQDYGQLRIDRSIEVHADPHKTDLMPFQLKTCLVTGRVRIASQGLSLKALRFDAVN